MIDWFLIICSYYCFFVFACLFVTLIMFFIDWFHWFFRQGDQLIEVNDRNLVTASVEEAYQVLNTLPNGKVSLKVIKTEQMPTNVNHALDKLTNERALLDNKLTKKSKDLNEYRLSSEQESFGEYKLHWFLSCSLQTYCFDIWLGNTYRSMCCFNVFYRRRFNLVPSVDAETRKWKEKR